MRILLITNDSYPFVPGASSDWCQTLIEEFSHHRFFILAITSDTTDAVHTPVSLPGNVGGFAHLALGKAQPQRQLAYGKNIQLFDEGLEDCLGFLHRNIVDFAIGLQNLAQLGNTYDLWPLFRRRAVWQQLQKHLRRELVYTPRLAEIALIADWLQGTLTPLLCTPPKADVVHSSSNGPAAVCAWLATKIHGIPLIVSEQDIFLRQHLLTSGDMNPALKLVQNRFYASLSRLIYLQADRIITTSNLNRQWQLRLGASAERTQLIYNGLQPGGRIANTAQANPTALWLGDLNNPDLNTLLQAFREVARQLPFAELRLYSKKQETFNTLQALENKLESYNLKRHVRFCGQADKLSRIFREADVVVQLSNSDSIPTALLHAMFAGKAIIASHSAGNAEALAESGVLVSPNSTAELSAAIVRLLCIEEERFRLGALAFRRAMSRFTTSHMLGQYARVYDGILSNPLGAEDPVILLRHDSEASDDIVIIQDNL